MSLRQSIFPSRRRHTLDWGDWSSEVFFKQKTAYEILACWSSDVCSSDLPRQNHAGPQHGARADLRTFIDAAIAADQYVVLNDHRRCVDWFKDAPNLRCRADVDMLAHLSAGTDQRVRIDHRTLIDIGADI